MSLSITSRRYASRSLTSSTRSRDDHADLSPNGEQVLSDPARRQECDRRREYRGPAPRFHPTPQPRPLTAITKAQSKPKETNPPAQRRCVASGVNPSDATPGSEDSKPFDSHASEGHSFDAWWSEGRSFDSWVSEVNLGGELLRPLVAKMGAGRKVVQQLGQQRMCSRFRKWYSNLEGCLD